MKSVCVDEVTRSDEEKSQVEEKREFDRLRAIATRRGYHIQKSRCRIPELAGYDPYRIVDRRSGFIVGGGYGPVNYGMSIDDVREWFRDSE